MLGHGRYPNEERAHCLARGHSVDEGALLNLLLTNPEFTDAQLRVMLDIADAHGFNYAVWVMKSSSKRHGVRR